LLPYNGYRVFSSLMGVVGHPDQRATLRPVNRFKGKPPPVGRAGRVHKHLGL
jgi:hypothetical protein